jgi:hypothetical protein
LFDTILLFRQFPQLSQNRVGCPAPQPPVQGQGQDRRRQPAAEPAVELLLDVDREYREKASVYQE